jgi:HEAT repeat protein
MQNATEIMKLLKSVEGSSQQTIAKLKPYYYSANDLERNTAIDVLASLNEPDAARELLQIYNDCEWRTTKITIIRALSRVPFQRTLEFLMNLAKDERDITLSQESIKALGKSGTRLAARFLVNFYQHCSTVVRPSVVSALGSIPDRTLAADFLSELPKALDANEIMMLKSLVVTLAELKVTEAIPYFEKIMTETDNRSLALCALLGMGKLSRSPTSLNLFETYFEKDPFEYQIFINVRSQIQFRAEWRLEDYLLKLFEAESFHPSLPFELNTFPREEQKTGLQIFSGNNEYFQRLCVALSKISHPDIGTWYLEFFDFDKLTREQTFNILESMQGHCTRSLFEALIQLKSRSLRDSSSPIFEKWLQTVSLCVPEAEVEFRDFMLGPKYTSLRPEEKIITINHLVNYALTLHGNDDRIQAIVRDLEQHLLGETSIVVQSRILRALGQMQCQSNKIVAFVKDRLFDKHLTPSCLFFLEKVPQRTAYSWVVKVIEDADLRTSFPHGILKALAAHKGQFDDNSSMESFLKRCIALDRDADTQVLALKVLAKHPIRSLFQDVVKLLKASDRVQIAAIIALKNAQNDLSVLPLSECLTSPSVSVAGRALDALTALSSDLAKEIIIDHLEKQSADLEFCDKISRCLKPPQKHRPDLGERLHRFLEIHPTHALYDGISRLRDEFGYVSKSSATYDPDRVGTLVDLKQLDQELTQRIDGYSKLDEQVKAVLRAAEIPFNLPEGFKGNIDRSSAILQYSKAIDLMLEKELGYKLLFPRLEAQMHQFQNLVHTTGLAEEGISPDKMLRFFELDSSFTPETLPLAKMVNVAKGVLNGKILNEHWKVLDGLRGWAAALLMFARPIGGAPRSRGDAGKGRKVLIKIKSEIDPEIITFTKRLLAYQEIRNGVAHRQVICELSALDGFRREAHEILSVAGRIV